jgi:hypothetical protein
VILMAATAAGLPVVSRPGASPKEFGRAGGGPGEFRRAVFATVGPHDSVYIFDQGNARVTILDPDQRFVRSAPAPLHTYALLWAADENQLILNAHVADRSRIGLAFHSFDRVGNEIRSFGPADSPSLPEDPGTAVRKKSSIDPDGGLLAVTWFGPYDIERWTFAGELIGHYRIASPEHQYQRPPHLTEMPPPPPTTQAIARDGDGRVWVVTRVADQHWKRGVKAVLSTAGREGGWTIDDIDPGKYHDTLIDVFDLAIPSLLTRYRMDSSCRAITAQWEIICESQNSDGSYRIDFRRVALIVPESGTRPNRTE